MTRATLVTIVVVLILVGYGTAMSIVIFRAERSSVSQTEWETAQARLSALENAWNAVVSGEADSSAGSVAVDAATIPINQADQDLLEELPGIGPVRATAILEARAAGPFVSLDDFRTRVPAIPNSVFDDISTKITFDIQ